MTKNSALLLTLLFGLLITGCSSKELIHITVTNPTNKNISDAIVESRIDLKYQPTAINLNDGDIPFQIIDVAGKRKIKFAADIKPNEKKTFTIENDLSLDPNRFTPRTYAELSRKEGDVYFDKRFRGNKFVKVERLKVPSIHTDHDALFKYEGPGWESELVGYRFYLDWRNATDIFGKKKNQLVLEQVGIHDTVAKDDSYHTMQDWGMDIFKVGSSLGIGSIGMWAEGKVHMVSKTDSIICAIPYTGPVEAKVVTDYYGWQVGQTKFDLTSSLSITAGSRLTKCEIAISGNAENIVTGLAKYENTILIKGQNTTGWNYIALYGKQTLVNKEDKLGIVIFYKNEELSELMEDNLSYIVKLKPNSGRATYHFAAAWEQEEGGIKNIDEFTNYLDETIHILNNPIIVDIK